MKRILLVDDDAVVLELYRRKLIQAGFEVQFAQDGLQAVKALSAGAPDLLVLDRMMPRLSGEDVLRFMASKPVLAAVPVVLLTNSFVGEPTPAAPPFKISRSITKGESTPAKLVETVCELLGVDAVGPTSAANNSHNVGSPAPVTPIINDEARAHFLKVAPTSYKNLRELCAEFTLNPAAASRSGNLAELYRQTHHLTGAQPRVLTQCRADGRRAGSVAV